MKGITEIVPCYCCCYESRTALNGCCGSLLDQQPRSRRMGDLYKNFRGSRCTTRMYKVHIMNSEELVQIKAISTLIEQEVDLVLKRPRV